jgi:hypothetical protein
MEGAVMGNVDLTIKAASYQVFQFCLANGKERLSVSGKYWPHFLLCKAMEL